MNGAGWLVRRLKAGGVDRVFALCGNGLDPLLDACLDVDLQVLDVRNEQSAAAMADVWARLTGRLGVVAVSSGPGHTNALTGLANAFWDGAPLLLISGASPAVPGGTDVFQELDQVAMAAPAAKLARRVEHVADLPGALEGALAQALNGRPGPVHLTIPQDVLAAPMPALPGLARQAPLAAVQPGSAPASASLDRAMDALASSERPFAVVGSGAFYARAWGPLRELLSITGMPAVSHIWDRGVIEAPIPQYLGVTNAELNGAMAALAQADCLLLVGARLDHRLGYGLPPAVAPDCRIVRLDSDPLEVCRGRVPDAAVVGDLRQTLEGLVVAAGQRTWDHASWLADATAARDARLAQFAHLEGSDDCPVPGYCICRALQPFVQDDVTFLIDGGNIGRWAHMLLFDRHPAHWLTCGASGLVGWGIPGAVAARLARPGRPVLLLSGDGAAGFVISDIETALRFGTPYVAVIAHDGAWGIVADGQPEGRRVGSMLGEIRFDRVAQALGARGLQVARIADLGPAVEEALQLNTVTVIQVPTRPGGLGAWCR